MAFVFLPVIRHIKMLHNVKASSGGGLGRVGFDGDGSINGVVKEMGVTVGRRVFLYDRRTGELVKTTKSDELLGEFVFLGLDKNRHYFMVSLDEFDDGRDFNLVGQDKVKAT